MMKFRQAVDKGAAKWEDMIDYVDVWAEFYRDVPLRSFLGLGQDELYLIRDIDPR